MTQKTSSADDLIKASPEGRVELSEDQLDAVAGGEKTAITQDITVNKAKTADKAAQAVDGFIRG